MSSYPRIPLAIIVLTSLIFLSVTGCAEKVSGMSLDPDGLYDSTNKVENVAQMQDGDGSHWTMSTEAAVPTQSLIDEEGIAIQTSGPVTALSVLGAKLNSGKDIHIEDLVINGPDGKPLLTATVLDAKASDVITALNEQAATIAAAVAGLGKDQALVEIEKLKTQGKISGDVASLASSIISKLITP